MNGSPGAFLFFELLFEIALDRIVDGFHLAVGPWMSRRGKCLADLELIADFSNSRIVELRTVVEHN